MTIDFKTVVPAAQAGDKAAQDALMKDFYAWSVFVAKTIARDPELAKDIAVAFWAWLFTEGGVLEYDPAKGAFFSWMEMRIKYRVKDAVKSQSPKLVYFSEVNDPEAFDPDPTDRLSALQDLEAIAAKLRGPTQKEVFWRLIEGATPKEIADECGISEKRARNVIGEVRELIRATIGD